MSGWIVVLSLVGCGDALKALGSDAFDVAILEAEDCSSSSGPVDEQEQSLELADVGDGVLAVIHRCATVDACAEDDDLVVTKTQGDGAIDLAYEWLGDRCDFSYPQDIYYELEGVTAGDWTVRYGSVFAEITME